MESTNLNFALPGIGVARSAFLGERHLAGTRGARLAGLALAMTLVAGLVAQPSVSMAQTAGSPLGLVAGRPQLVSTVLPQVTPSSVKLAPTSVAVMSGKTTKLKATISPSSASQAVTWSSAKKATATVSSAGVVTGKVTGKGKSAKVAVTATSKTGSKKASATVQVYTAHDVQARLNTLTCKDANKKALSVDGKFGAASTAALKNFQKAAGRTTSGTPDSATLTALFSSKAPKCVTPVTITGVSLAPTSVTVMSGKTAALKATVSPSNASQAVTWSSANTAIATVSAGVVTGKANGVGKSGKVAITAKTGTKSATAQAQVYTAQDVQARINALSCKDATGKALVVDGQFGTNSANALKNWQKAANRTQSGTPDSATLTALFASSAPKCALAPVAPVAPPVAPSTSATSSTATATPTGATSTGTGTTPPTGSTATGTGATATPTGPTTPTTTTAAATSTTTTPATMTLTGGMTVKNPLTQGTPVTVTGTISSNSAIKSVTAVIATKAGVTAFSCSASPNANSYSLSPCDSPLKFSQLIPGDYVYTVKATNATSSNLALTSQAFTVKASSSAPGVCIAYASAKLADDQYAVPTADKGKATMAALVAIAQSQTGYHEGTYAAYAGCVWFPTTADSGNWTKYGVPYGLGNANGGWCAAFVSWSARQAGVPTSVILDYVSTTAGVNWYKAQKDSKGASRFHASNGSYAPKAGDIVFYYSGGSWYHTGLVASYDSKTGKLTTIEGNNNDQVRVVTQTLATAVSIGGFGSNS